MIQIISEEQAATNQEFKNTVRETLLKIICRHDVADPAPFLLKKQLIAYLIDRTNDLEVTQNNIVYAISLNSQIYKPEHERYRSLLKRAIYFDNKEETWTPGEKAWSDIVTAPEHFWISDIRLNDFLDALVEHTLCENKLLDIVGRMSMAIFYPDDAYKAGKDYLRETNQKGESNE